ncbi:5-methyltetrahydropteroyltriglutamate--homocysteine S-methyltransferase [Desulfurobacterium thermolithotrophum DSM 11699]|uniref:5-methyltetrahydropteroyltriglutamate--homocysteine S-methyltransferase n=1 Tax=Desulfurobacterium thermolithotrophum (strain DSM 11699 / BSA) TaxID=868864 RepID=F0S1Q5_DESTD|nr:5-methyltetrahydropteroyltriglutamate--homocysteine S-methyltransferase [Desulfurobacterium thermolithotrophum]ADY72910.1 5-methyltetrahydropteroyltriglutamate--homocysteine S-methyltransferase [Desulfurobacterium thermolithotrophum DSM 11699]
MKTYAYGFPRLGKQREFKRLIEGYWAQKVTEEELLTGIKELNRKREETYQKYVNAHPQGEMTLYDPMLDMALLFGVYKAETLDEYFNLCRGKDALEMTKWFNTNYHYLVPDFEGKKPCFKVTTPVWNRHEGARENVHLIAPFTFLKLSKNLPQEYFEEALKELTEIVVQYINEKGFESVHLEDPALVMELTEKEWNLIQDAYKSFEKANAEINIFTYYDSVDCLQKLFDLPVSGVGVDFAHDRGENLAQLREIDPKGKKLFAGVVDGRNVWRNDLFKTAEVISELSKKFDVVVTNAAPLFHLPVNLLGVTLPEELLKKVAFAEEKLKELQLISQILSGDEAEAKEWVAELESSFGEITKVRERVKSLKEEDFVRKPSYQERIKKQQEVLNLPLFPTTTIGSFPQTEEVRRVRLLYKKGRLSEEDYKTFIRGEIAKAIQIQEDLDIDVFVHGEFERTDMVEFFAEKMKGIATTGNGWVISYGTRCYRPPIIYGDVERDGQMTISEIVFAQSLTEKPVKGMLTGPVTIIAWSYVREDIPTSEVAYQIALALKDEIKDYEKAGIKIVQIDEPAIREKAPIKKRNWDEYFDWAIKSFRLCHSSVKPETQIHTHMCYSEFGEIINYIVDMDFDVISIEASRSKGDIIETFEKVAFDRQIGLGVWDIHSPYVPSLEEMEVIVERALKVIPKENFWINPDCGLKTRRWEEVIPALKNMITVARKLRKT